MGRPSARQPRVVVYIYAGPSLFDEEKEDDALREQFCQHCQEQGYWPIEICVNRQSPKKELHDYPALAAMASDPTALLIVLRTPTYRRGRVADWLESRCPEGSYICLRTEDLRARGLLPPLPVRCSPSRKRSAQSGQKQPAPLRATYVRPPQTETAAAQRAKILRMQGLDVRHIGQVLGEEGHQPSYGHTWTVYEVARLLGLEVLDGGRGVSMAAESKPWGWGR